MARGKHTTQSAVRRAEAAHEHIDRLTDQVVEAKTRARRYEADALRVPALEHELTRLRQQIDDTTSDVLERERRRHAGEEVALLGRISELGRVLRDLCDRNDKALTPRELCIVDRCAGMAFKDGSMSRRQRRTKLGGYEQILTNATDAELRECGLRRVGERFRRIEPPAPLDTCDEPE